MMRCTNRLRSLHCVCDPRTVCALYCRSRHLLHCVHDDAERLRHQIGRDTTLCFLREDVLLLIGTTAALSMSWVMTIWQELNDSAHNSFWGRVIRCRSLSAIFTAFLCTYWHCDCDRLSRSHDFAPGPGAGGRHLRVAPFGGTPGRLHAHVRLNIGETDICCCG